MARAKICAEWNNVNDGGDSSEQHTIDDTASETVFVKNVSEALPQRCDDSNTGDVGDLAPAAGTEMLVFTPRDSNHSKKFKTSSVNSRRCDYSTFWVDL